MPGRLHRFFAPPLASASGREAEGGACGGSGSGRRLRRPPPRGPRGDVSDEDVCPGEPLEDAVVDRPAEPCRAERPLELLHAAAKCAKAWEEVIGDERLRSWMHVKRKHEAVQADDFDVLLQRTAWRELTSRSHRVTRRTAWLVEGGCRCPYRYGSEEVESTCMPEWFSQMMARWLKDLCCGRCALPDSANLNLYEHGAHAVGWHADDEALFGGRMGDCAIVSVTLGDTRRFRAALRAGRRGHRLVPDRASLRDVELGHGDLCTMEGRFQKHYIHSLSPCRRDRVGPRINVTFRWIRRHTSRECPWRTAPLPAHRQRPRWRGARTTGGLRDQDEEDSRKLPVSSGSAAKQYHLFDHEGGRLTGLGFALFWVAGLSLWAIALFSK